MSKTGFPNTSNGESNDLSKAYRSYIKTLYILLPKYEYKHFVPEEESNSNSYVGREEVKARLTDYLSTGTKGSYLITGFRGMGKTSLVKICINEVKRKGSIYQNSYDNFQEATKKVLDINVSFGQKNINEVEILKQIITSLIYDLQKRKSIRLYNFFHSNLNVLLSSLALFFSISILYVGLGLISNYYFNNEINEKTDKNEIRIEKYMPKENLKEEEDIEDIMLLYKIIQDKGIDILPILMLFMFSYVLVFFLYTFSSGLFILFNYNVRAYKRLVHLTVRSSSSFTKEKDSSFIFDQFIFKSESKRIENYPIASSKEIVNELIGILDTLSKNNKVIIIFDELDKMDNEVNTNFSFSDNKVTEEVFMNIMPQQKKRQIAVMDVLASMKYLITEAKAKFVFIAGSEMFDAALADVSDRQSYLSSIFGHIINVNSLLKDRSGNTLNGKGFTDLTEEFLIKIITKGSLGNHKDLLKVISRLVNFDSSAEVIDNRVNSIKVDEFSIDNIKSVFTMQEYLLYLTIRSNGSPKKMIRLIEENIVKKSVKDLLKEKGVEGVFKNNQFTTLNYWMHISVKLYHPFRSKLYHL